ncbi:unnamed protein product, partial [Ectocarpus sp. 12 AP-2014]
PPPVQARTRPLARPPPPSSLLLSPLSTDRVPSIAASVVDIPRRRGPAAAGRRSSWREEDALGLFALLAPTLLPPKISPTPSPKRVPSAPTPPPPPPGMGSRSRRRDRSGVATRPCKDSNEREREAVEFLEAAVSRGWPPSPRSPSSACDGKG